MTMGWKDLGVWRTGACRPFELEEKLEIVTRGSSLTWQQDGLWHHVPFLSSLGKFHCVLVSFSTK